MQDQLQKQAALQELLKKIQNGEVQLPTGSIPMEAAPVEPMTPEKALEIERLAKGRNPASSDMLSVPIEEFQPKGAYDAKAGKPGQSDMEDISGELSPEDNDKNQRLMKLRAMIQGR